MENELTQEYLRSVLDYDPMTGIFKWKEYRPVSHFKNEHAWKTYIGRFAGKVAGHIHRLNTSDHLQYIQLRINRKLYMAHRVACLYEYGFSPDGLVDHIDGNGLNNKMDNLRIVDQATNGRNGKLSKNNKSGVNGVYWNNRDSNWVAEGHYTENGVNKKKFLGSYSNLEDAKNARKSWEDSEGNFTDRHGKPLTKSLPT